MLTVNPPQPNPSQINLTQAMSMSNTIPSSLPLQCCSQRRSTASGVHCS